MKRLVFLILCIIVCFAAMTASAEGIDLSAMTYDELVALRGQIDVEIAARGKTDVPADDFGMWEITNYVDEFNLPTDARYIRNSALIHGSFSNSAANNRDLTVRFLIDDFNADIMLYEYGTHQVKNAYSSDDEGFTIVMLDKDQMKYYIEGFIKPNSDRISLPFLSRKYLIDALSKGGPLMFSITNKKYATDKYSFTIEDTSYFSNAYDAFLGDEKDIDGYRLPEGEYTVGTHIPAGTYRIVSKKYYSLLRVYEYIEFDPNDPWTTWYAPYTKNKDYDRYAFSSTENTLQIDGIELVDGQKIEVSSGKLMFIPQ